eukprot:TRINITY_DN6643_c2_g1_i3.p6 TRINITY_DN6643_c2_g1~~TRINITY_DN6643_c2_g1_i3.p6  ORF type:complete len:148 (+),score=5.70 TRINITY_DN6643_c2_g1_i3:684-1127(+)
MQQKKNTLTELFAKIKVPTFPLNLKKIYLLEKQKMGQFEQQHLVQIYTRNQKYYQNVNLRQKSKTGQLQQYYLNLNLRQKYKNGATLIIQFKSKFAVKKHKNINVKKPQIDKLLHKNYQKRKNKVYIGTKYLINPVENFTKQILRKC